MMIWSLARSVGWMVVGTLSTVATVKDKRKWSEGRKRRTRERLERFNWLILLIVTRFPLALNRFFSLLVLIMNMNEFVRFVFCVARIHTRGGWYSHFFFCINRCFFEREHILPKQNKKHYSISFGNFRKPNDQRWMREKWEKRRRGG